LPAILYTYDDDNRLATVSDGTVGATYGYDPAGNVTTSSYLNGTSTTRVFDRARRVSNITHKAGTTTLATYVFTRDLEGQPTKIVSTGTGVAETRSFTYDTADRLLTVCYSATATCAAADKTTWTYDLVGNRLTQQVGTAATTSYTYDPADQLTLEVNSGNERRYTYDPNGSVVTDKTFDAGLFENTAKTREMSYDAENRLISTYGRLASDVFEKNRYDGRGNRRSSFIEQNAQSGSFISFERYYRWDQVGGMARLAQDYGPVGASGNGPYNSNTSYVYGHGQIGQRIDTPVQPPYVDPATVEASHFLIDELGSTTHVTSPTGVATSSLKYSVFGSVRSGSSPRIGFAGMERPDQFGTMNFRARSYNPNTGRFLQVDPLNRGAAERWMSPYTYAASNPLVYVDPTGQREMMAYDSQACRNVLDAETLRQAKKAMAATTNPLQKAGIFTTAVLQKAAVNTQPGFSDAVCKSIAGDYSGAAKSALTQELNNASAVGPVVTRGTKLVAAANGVGKSTPAAIIVGTNTPVDDVVDLYKGPQPGQSTGPLNPKDFPGKAGAVPDGRAYFTPDKALAEQWAKQYGTQPIKVTMPRSAYDQMNNFLKNVPNAGEMRYLGGAAGQTEVLVPRWMIPWLNKFPIGPA
jgi:RHS repeat-associated protein